MNASGPNAMPAHRRMLIGLIRASFPAASQLADIEHCLGEGLRRFLRQVVSDAARDQPMLVSARELLGVDAGVRVRGAVRIAFHRDRRNRDRWKGGERLFKVVEFPFAL